MWECKQCYSECRVRAEPDELIDGVTWTVQYLYCIRHGDQYKKMTAGDDVIITRVK